MIVRGNPRGFRQERSHHGFTVVELLVGTSIALLVGAVGLRLFQAVTRTQRTFSQQVTLQMDARKAFDQVFDQIREGTDIVRPFIGETLPFLVYKDLLNRTTMLYLEANDDLSKHLKKCVYRLISYRAEPSGAFTAANEKILHDSIRRLTFTCLSPNGVQVNATVLNERGEFPFLAHIGLMNIGGLE